MTAIRCFVFTSRVFVGIHSWYTDQAITAEVFDTAYSDHDEADGWTVDCQFAVSEEFSDDRSNDGPVSPLASQSTVRSASRTMLRTRLTETGN